MSSIEQCEVISFDKAKVKRVQSALNAQNTRPMVQLFKALADETRAKVAYALCREEELCVCDAAQAIGTTVANASHHLRHLKQQGLAKLRKDGKMVFYSLDDDHVKQLVMLAMEHAQEGKRHGE